MTKEQFLKLELVSKAYVMYKNAKHWVIGKDLDECLLEVVEDDDGECLVWKAKMVRFENCVYEIKEIKKELTEEEKFWQDHKIGDEYQMDGKPDKWKISYYPILEDGKTNEKYNESRALVEKPIVGGTDFREIPLRYLTKIGK